MEIAEITEPLSGSKLYQQRARSALPLLVRQATASTPIVYEDLAHELEMSNPMNLNYVLGSIGHLRKQEIDAYEPSFVYKAIGNMVFWTLIILGGFIRGLIWAALENK